MTNANGIIGFYGSGVAHGQMAYYPSKYAFGFINSSAQHPGSDYGDLSWDRSFMDIWANDGIFKGNVRTPYVSTNNDEINRSNGGNLHIGYRNTDNTILQANGGSVGIGTSLNANPNNYKLAVNGTIGAKEVKVEISSQTWADYVFEPTYQLPTLTQVESYIKKNKHLPDVPSAKEVEKEGIDLGKMDATLLKKIEELTLYVIEQGKKLTELEKANALLQQQMKQQIPK